VAAVVAGVVAAGSCCSTLARASELRRTAIVRAVESARQSVVNIRGEKSVPLEVPLGSAEAGRRINGMGSGVVIDERGYILTNYHVVEGVQNTQVTLANGRSFPAKIVAFHVGADLAVIKVDGAGKLPVIDFGISSDLMLGEPVVAVGNPYGYEHTVTRGIISALHRTVQVTETQTYDDLIQTDASINPGNSGGPLLNIDGELIGICVAVRAGAQGIAFAIPVDKALAAATNLLASRTGENLWHGLTPDTAANPARPGYVIKTVQAGSPAEQAGLRPGDAIVSIGEQALERALDFERALLDERPGDELDLIIERQGEEIHQQLLLAAPPARANEGDQVWRVLGLRLTPIDPQVFQRYRTRYNGGLRVQEVRPGSPAARQNIRRGDVLLGMHIWETVSIDNVQYILNRHDLPTFDPIKFYILRGNETLFGHMAVGTERK
jgi:serine protease Do